MGANKASSIVFFLLKPDHLAFILSARDMDRKERRQYERA